MRILTISDVYFPRINGVSTSILTFTREFQRKGHQVTIIAPEYGRPWGKDEGVIRVPAFRVPLDPEDRLPDPRSIRRLTESLRRQSFDVVHVQTPFVAHFAGARLARALDLPVLETYHTFFEEYLYHYAPFLPRALLRYLARHFSARQCNRMDALVVPSSAMLAQLREYGVRTPATVIPTGIDLDDFQRCDGAAFRARFGIPLERPLLVYIGRVAFEKNIGFLLDVLHTLHRERPDVELVIAGEGPATGSLRAQSGRLGISERVHFVGYLDRSGDLLDCYCAADAFVFASRTETQGLVLLEAMALGVPVVALAAMGTTDVLREGQGALIAPDDVEGFAGRVGTLLGDRELARRLGESGRLYVRGWSAEACAERVLAQYAALVERRRGVPGPHGRR